jgi:hypothetical protein
LRLELDFLLGLALSWLLGEDLFEPSEGSLCELGCRLGSRLGFRLWLLLFGLSSWLGLLNGLGLSLSRGRLISCCRLVCGLVDFLLWRHD